MSKPLKVSAEQDETGPDCPKCGSDRVVPIMYGLVSDTVIIELEEYGRRGQDPPYVLGGCVLGSEGVWHFNKCGHNWAPLHPGS